MTERERWVGIYTETLKFMEIPEAQITELLNKKGAVDLTWSPGFCARADAVMNGLLETQ